MRTATPQIEPSPVRISFRLRYRDAVALYADSPIGRIGVVAGLVFAAMAPFSPYHNGLLVFASGLGAAIVLLVVGPIEGVYVNGATKIVGTVINLTLDETGVLGWPLAGQIPKEWNRLGSVTERGGVLVLAFRSAFGSQVAWVGVPTGAISPDDLRSIRALVRVHHRPRRWRLGHPRREDSTR